MDSGNNLFRNLTISQSRAFHHLSFKFGRVSTLPWLWVGKINCVVSAWKRFRINRNAPTGHICTFNFYCPHFCGFQKLLSIPKTNTFVTHNNQLQTNLNLSKMSTKLFQLMPELDMQEMAYVESLVKNYNDQQMLNFANFYRSRRRDPQLLLLAGLAGFVGIAGVQRFLTDQIGMGILYLFTAGLCFIGTIVDLINHKQLALEYNIKVANEVSGWIARMAE